MYSLSDTKRLYNYAKVEQNVKEQFPELSDINDYLCAILYRTAYFSQHIDEETSYKSVNYIVDLLKSLDKEELGKINHHLIDSFTYPYNLKNDAVINGINAIFRPNSCDDEFKYIEAFTIIFNRFVGVYAAGIEVCKYRNIDLLVKTFCDFVISDVASLRYIAVLKFVIPYIYQHIEEYDENKLMNLFNKIYSTYYLDKMSLNTCIPLNESIEGIIDNIPNRYSKEQFITTYKLIINLVNSIINNEDKSEEKVIR